MLAVFLYGKKSLKSERTFTRIKKVNNRLQERSDFMGDTKEAILTTALQLFAGNGYEAVSVSEIAGRKAHYINTIRTNGIFLTIF